MHELRLTIVFPDARALVDGLERAAIEGRLVQVSVNGVDAEARIDTMEHQGFGPHDGASRVRAEIMADRS